MKKPNSLSVKNFLIRKISSDIVVPESTIETVINHQFNTALDATLINRSVEISGFGKFIFNDKRGAKMMEKLLSQKEVFENLLSLELLSPQKRRSSQAKLDVVLNNIRALKPKLNED